MRYCKSTIFQANHNMLKSTAFWCVLFAILQKYDFSSKSQQGVGLTYLIMVVCDTAKVRFFKQITTQKLGQFECKSLFAILQKYDFSSKSQPSVYNGNVNLCCLRYCKSTIFQANHNLLINFCQLRCVVCDTAKVRFFKQITTEAAVSPVEDELFAILQKYDFSSKSQLSSDRRLLPICCLRYCKSTIFQANHNIRNQKQRYK